MLDESFYKPRDIIWRLSIAQKAFPSESKFTSQVIQETALEYSSKLWDEVRYELSAIYSDVEVEAIEIALSGGPSRFMLGDMESRFEVAARHSRHTQALVARRSVREILQDLYRLGAIGNTFRVGSTGTDIRNRWAFRGDPTLLVDKGMELHQSLIKRLSAVATRRRGTRAGKDTKTSG